MEKIDVNLLDESKSLHIHEHPQIIFPLKEPLHLWIGDRSYGVAPHELCFIPPHIRHQCVCGDRLLVINIPPALISEKDRCFLGQPLLMPLTEQLEPLLSLIISEAAADPHNTSLNYLFYYLYSKLLLNRDSAALRYINEHFDEPISVAQLARLENYNSTYFIDWFKSQTGFSPSLYLRHTRIAKAKELLASTDYQIVDIALMVGYNSQSAFARVFRSLTGATPREYRQQLQGRR